MNPHRTTHVHVLPENDVLEREDAVPAARSRLDDRTNIIMFGVVTVLDDQVLQS